MSIYTARPLPAWPHIEIFEADGTSAPKPINLDPPVISSPFTMGYSSNLSQLALAYNMRPGESEGIGNPDDDAPIGGSRVVAYDDSFIVFGGWEGRPATIYRRAGPTFVKAQSLWSVIPTTTYSEIEYSPSDHVFVGRRGDNVMSFDIFKLVDGRFELIFNVTIPDKTGRFYFATSGKYIAFVGFGGTWRLYNVETNSLRANVAQGAGINAFSPTSSLLVTGGGAGGTLSHLEAWDIDDLTGGPGGTFLGYVFPGDTFYGLCEFSRDGSKMLAQVRAGSQHRTKIFNVLDGFTLFPAVHPRSNYGIAQSLNESVQAKLSEDGAFASVRRSTSVDHMTSSFETTPFRPAKYTHAVHGTTSFVECEGGLLFRRYVRVGGGYGIVGYEVDANGALTQTRIYNPTSSAWSDWVAAKFSSDLKYGIFVDVSHMTLVKWGTNSYAHVQGPIARGGGTFREIAAEANLEYFALCFSNVSSVRLFKRTGNTVALVTTVNVSSTSSSACSFDVSGSKLAVAHGTKVTVWSRDGDSLVDPVETDVGATVTSVRITSDGTRVIVLAGTLRCYSLHGSSMTLQSEASSEGAAATAMAVSKDNTRIVLGGARVFSLTGGHLALVGKTFPQTIHSWVSYSSDGSYFVTSDTSSYVSNGAPFYRTQIYTEGDPIEVRDYSVANQQAVSSATRLWGYSPDGDIIHYGDGTTNFHKSTADYSQVSALPFEPDKNSSLVFDVKYSQIGDVVLWNTPDGLETGVRAPGGIVKVSNLDGTFVSVYVKNGDSLVEKGYIAHERGSKILNMVFSATPLLFSYLSITPDGHPLRRIYDTGGGRLNLAWSFTRPDLLDNYLAFSPFESNFAMTFDWSELDSEIRLYSIDGGLNVLELDDKQVSFGPLAYSSCDDIVVAHGGLTNPFTHYKVVEDELVKQEYLADFEWGVTAPILHISFVGDCSQLVIITEEEIITVEKDEESEEGFKEQDYAPLKEPADKGSNAVVGAGGGVWSGGGVNGGGGGSGGGIGGNGGGGYSVGPGGSLNPLGTTPYVAINIAYRV